MTEAPRKDRFGLIVEVGLLSLVILSLFLVARIFILYGYLPAPYFYDTDDTFMDWFNPAYWANNSGAYDIWRTVYPPLSFVFLRLFSLHACYVRDPFFGRHCDWLGLITIWIFFLINIAIVFDSYRLSNRRTAWIRTAALCLGFPMLYTLERGNLIIPCFTFFALGTGRVLRSARLKWLSLAMAINFKPYLVIMLFAHLVRRRWRWVEGGAVAALVIYLITFALEGAGTPQEILKDIKSFALDVPNAFVLSEAYFSTSFAPMIHLITSDFPLINAMGSRTVETLGFLLSLLIHIGQAGVLTAIGATILCGRPIPLNRIGALGIALLVTTTDPGGYAQLFLLFLVFFEPWRGLARVTMLICAYLLSLSVDLRLTGIEHHLRDVYLSRRTVDYELGVYLGEFLRPFFIMLIEYCLVAVTLLDLWKARGTAPGRGGATGLSNVSVVDNH